MCSIIDKNYSPLLDNSFALKRKHEEASEERAAKRQKTDLFFDRLSSSELTDAIFLEKVASIPNLTKIKWVHGFNEVTDKGLEGLKSRTQALTSLNLQSAGRISGQSLSQLVSECTQLRSVDFSNCTKVTCIFINALSHCSSLEKLSLQYCSHLTDESIKAIGLNCPNIKFLDLSGCENCTDESIQSVLASAKNLKRLNLSFCKLLTDALLPVIASSNQLETLNLSNCSELTDKAFLPLERRHFYSLKEIDLSATFITSVTLQKFIEIGLGSSLLTLNLNHCSGIDGQSFKKIPSFLRLKRLEIASNILNKYLGILEKLKKCLQIEILNLNHLQAFEGMKFTHSDVYPLIRSLPSLKVLHVAGLGKAEDFKEIAHFNKNLQLIFR